MLDALDITEEEAAGLTELAALELAAAKEFSARSLAVGDPKLATELARTAQRHGRGYRQTLAMKQRLKREITQAAAEAPEAPKPHVPRDSQRIKARVDELRDPLQRVIWTEHEKPDPPEDEDDDLAGYHFRLLEERLRTLSRDNSFGQQPLDDHVVEVARGLGLCEASAARWRDLPEVPDHAFIDWPDDEDEDDEDTS